MADPGPDRDTIEQNGQIVEPSAAAFAAPPSSSAGNIPAPGAIIANPNSLSRSEYTQKSDQALNTLDAIPSGAPGTAAQAAKIVSAMVKPVPWLGPAVELVAAIVSLCQNVSQNKYAAVELSKHCEKMLETIKEVFRDSSPDGAKSMAAELEGLLGRIGEKLEKWRSMHFFKAIVKQDSISSGIMSFHVEIDQFCKRYSIFTQSVIVNWLEIHERQSKADMAEIKKFFAAFESRQLLENMCRREEITELREDFTALLEVVQHFLLQSEQESTQRKELEENFSAMCRSSGEMPPDVELTEGLLQRKKAIFGNGTFDIYCGSCFGDTRPCAIKVLRCVKFSQHTKRRFQRQLSLWKSVHALDRGEHILPLIGAVFSDRSSDPFLCFVSPWMEKGNALKYVQTGENIDRVRLIQGIAEGLKVLHTHESPLLHGFIKASNILIDDFGNPLLADFGLLRIIEEERQLSVYSYPDTINAYRWLAPEMIAGVGFEGATAPDLTIKSDIFMFGMTALELMTGEKPYAHIKRDPQVLVYRSARGRILRPQNENGENTMLERGLNDRLWELLEKCWLDEPDGRPTIIDVLAVLQTLPVPRN